MEYPYFSPKIEKEKNDMKSMRKRPMTTGELFDAICKILKEKGKMPNILDYGLATHNPAPITNYEYSLINKLDYGKRRDLSGSVD